jgi:hypothetical protein
MNSFLIGPNILRDMEEILARIRKQLEAVEGHQTSYVDEYIIQNNFAVGEYAFLRIKTKRTS